jgi:hypothetical protein
MASMGLSNQGVPIRQANPPSSAHSSGVPRSASDAHAVSSAPNHAFSTPLTEPNGPIVSKDAVHMQRDNEVSSRHSSTMALGGSGALVRHPPTHAPPPHRSLEAEAVDASEVESHSTVYHKLTRLCADIETAIYTSRCAAATLTSSAAPTATPAAASDTRKALALIRSQSFAQKSPEAEYATRLFQYYTTQCTAYGYTGQGTSTSRSYEDEAVPSASTDGISISAYIHPCLYTGHPGQIHGVQGALRSNIFWMRGAVLVLALVCFLTMAYVPTLGHRLAAPVDIVQVLPITLLIYDIYMMYMI